MVFADGSLNDVQRLEALRERLAAEIEGCDDARALPALARQYRETLRDIRALEGGGGDDDIEELIGGLDAVR